MRIGGIIDQQINKLSESDKNFFTFSIINLEKDRIVDFIHNFTRIFEDLIVTEF